MYICFTTNKKMAAELYGKIVDFGVENGVLKIASVDPEDNAVISTSAITNRKDLPSEAVVFTTHRSVYRFLPTSAVPSDLK